MATHDLRGFLRVHRAVTRRYFLRAGGALAATMVAMPGGRIRQASAEPLEAATPAEPPLLGDGVKKTKSLLTPQQQFYDVSRGTPLPHSLSEERKREVGLTRDTWRLEVISDPEHPVTLRKPMSRTNDRAFDWSQLLEMAETRTVRFAKAMTCLNLGCPLGFGIWEGVPLRDVIGLAEPRDNVRRVFYYGCHNDQPEQMIRSSLPLGRVLEDYHDLPPVILCYKLNGQWLSAERGGPVRMVVPEHYGFKSVKWLTHVVLTSLPHANDTYAEQGNDIDSPMKTFAATIDVPREAKAGDPIPITGYAQVGISGLSKVQAWIHPDDQPLPTKDQFFFSSAPWVDMEILGPPVDWGGDLPEGKFPLPTIGFDSEDSRPLSWPMRLALVHWAGTLPGLPAGKYTLRCRAVDERGIAQPQPRPFRKSGHAALEQVKLVVT